MWFGGGDSGRQWLWSGVLWTLLVAASILWNYRHEHDFTLELAAQEARGNIGKDLAFRRWATLHGGVYVPVTELTQPNPRLQAYEREITTPSGRRLTLLDPAYVVRQMQDLFPGEVGVRGHITSLNPVNRGNGPDPWERRALDAFQRDGTREISAVADLGGKPYMRVIRAMVAESGCVKCHADFRAGDIRGSISASVSLEPYMQRERHLVSVLSASHAAIWLLGLAGMGWVYRRARLRQAARERAEAALRASEERYRAIMDSVPVGIFITQDLCFQKVNDQGAVLFGYRPEELEGRLGPMDLVAPEERAGLHRQLIEQIRGGISRTPYEMKCLRKDGSLFSALITSRVIELNGRQASVGSVLDISELKHTEEQLRLAAKVFEGANEGILISDSENRIVSVNRAFTRMTGYGPEAVLGRNPNLLKSGLQDGAWYQALWQALGAQNYWRGDIWNRREDGQVVRMGMSITVVRDEAGEALHYVAIYGDITERLAAEEAIRDLNESLERRVEERTQDLTKLNRELESFSYSISHDLRAPLRALNGYAQIISDQERDKLSDEGRHMLERIRQNAVKMGQLIDDLLQFSRVGRFEMEQVAISLDDVVWSVLEDLGREYPLVRVRVGALPKVRGDATMVRQILVNLLGNACKFTSRQEAPLVEVGCGVLGETSAERGPAGATYTYVRDNGAGFDMRYAQRLFGVFQRLHPDKDFPGTGAGLAIVKRIVERHGGRVWAEAEPGKGATFCFTLPLAHG